jgi:anti-anti-sigma factor
MQPGELEIRHTAQGSSHRLTLAGELDVATAARLEVAVTGLCAGTASEIVLDLSELAFLDSTGFRAILSAKERCQESGCEFLMTRAREPVQRVFDVSGVLRKLPFVGATDAEADS